ncbi:MAG: D-glycero-beta-D-manno-heptose-7-phosphate kinase [Proteobacteria bacterium]|jgi:D-beta-D-heptose 7-phosphate kinase/D-beta-D-heptose 1-phosphate adenosyltransferase|nr:D-glycero-beta-D-manno-heptose-7-phosphate kinase [Alphaproteobacteria bacterium]NCC02496.1 D-glycero-beta-D-manno-heptose-7-phosphate kinase [Pseudomonadota bacterium]
MLQHLHSKIEELSGHRILCIGDIMLDRFVYGHVERVSPEAPIPVLRVQREETTLGGGGNVVRNIVTLGGHVDVIGVIGQDQTGYHVTEKFSAMEGVVPYLLTDNTRPTTVKTRYVADGQQLLRADREISAPMSSSLEEQTLLRVRGAIDSCEIVVLSDYAKGVLTNKVISEIIRLAKSKNKPVIIDPKGRDFSRYRGAYMLTPNRKELSEATGHLIKTIQEAESAARYLIEAYELNGILAKLSGDGVCLVMKDFPAQHFKANAREVYDVSGAGDTVVATMALCMAGGLTLADSAALSNVAGSVVVGKIGTATVTQEELARELLYDQSRASDEKIVPLPEAAETAERWRKQGLKVGFTNGVFDLLHPGHLSLIRQSRAACDRLIIGLNSDSSVKRLKGENRPIQSEEARAAVLASLADVDDVVIFTEDTPLELIKAIRPNVLIKGADYTVDTVVGSDLVQGWGGEVVLANLVEGQSTTNTIKKMQA